MQLNTLLFRVSVQEEGGVRGSRTRYQIKPTRERKYLITENLEQSICEGVFWQIFLCPHTKIDHEFGTS
jgi:hypothetical protein